MNKTFLVTYEANYWDVNKAPQIRQEEIEIGVNEDMTDGQIVLALQDRLKGGYISCAIVLNFWEK